ncbi:hypothetical protein RIF29_03299 [Crotalaria pallida]|uniref:Uncharacterized protein n=1 Tax=Crotalaria pallida TaxID=3830 RepID=A0AAN9J009_CROPI
MVSEQFPSAFGVTFKDGFLTEIPNSEVVLCGKGGFHGGSRGGRNGSLGGARGSDEDVQGGACIGGGVWRQRVADSSMIGGGFAGCSAEVAGGGSVFRDGVVTRERIGFWREEDGSVFVVVRGSCCSPTTMVPFLATAPMVETA